LAGLFVAISVGLAGCAAQTAFREGNSLLAQGNGREGLAKLEEASRLDPGSAEYRVAYLQTRDRYAQALIDRADAARVQGRYDDAELGYRETLSVRAQQDRALSGLRLLDQQRRWDLVLKEVEGAMTRKDWELARGKLKLLLTESPRHPSALKLLEQIDQQTTKPRVEPALASGYKQPITVEFRDVPLRTIFEVISRTSRLNFLFDRDVKTDQRASIYLRNSTVEAAVNWLLLTNQLEQRVLDGSTVLIYPATAAKQSEYQPLTVKSFYRPTLTQRVLRAR
jgi:general secretion pathway protein D